MVLICACPPGHGVSRFSFWVSERCSWEQSTCPTCASWRSGLSSHPGRAIQIPITVHGYNELQMKCPKASFVIVLTCLALLVQNKAIKYSNKPMTLQYVHKYLITQPISCLHVIFLYRCIISICQWALVLWWKPWQIDEPRWSPNGNVYIIVNASFCKQSLLIIFLHTQVTFLRFCWKKSELTPN